MTYVKKIVKSTEYQGESFSDSLTKKNDIIWEDNEIAEYKLFDTKGNMVVSGSLTRSADLLSLTFLLGKSDTIDLFGVYRLLVYLSDTVVTEMNYVIAEYKLDYKKTTARND